MPSQIFPTSNRSLDSAVSTSSTAFIRPKEDQNDPSVSLLDHSATPSYRDLSLKPPLPRASSFTSSRTKPSRPRHSFNQKRRRRAASQDSFPNISDQTHTSTRSSFGRDVAAETFLLTRLGFKMLGYLGLDLYLPKNGSGPKPVVAFITGGAWIIGNFPQGTISDMIADSSQGIAFVCNNIAEYGGDPNRIYLMGQSAGAHIAACVIVEQAIKEAGEGESTSWSLSQIKTYFGLSGGIMEGEESLRRFSPEVMVQDPNIGNVNSLLPPVVLFHGTGDYSIPSDASKSFAETLKRVGVTAEAIMYDGKTHTDVFLQDPMRGGKDDMFEDLVGYIHAGDAEARARDAEAPPRRRLVPECMLKLAHSVSPF
ncbi:isoprenylcysteine alpha-carbonyl methylesterase [Vigna angularis]|uniref:protein-S-isoprenylcysteine alpha-carbonyl methylesterase n=1 Tax=Phaseolus angularis TaxID=3914 RepID=A0A8T0LFL5_PHAAN|nr:isoprenylcysteine alpha-carbonyl methylesterase [Vigna angularis]